jgi:hypothetical protein
LKRWTVSFALPRRVFRGRNNAIRQYVGAEIMATLNATA